MRFIKSISPRPALLARAPRVAAPSATFVPGHADVAGDPEDGPVDGAGFEESQEGLHQGRVRLFRVPAVDEAPTDGGTVS